MFIQKMLAWAKEIYHNRSFASKRQYLLEQGARIGEGTRLYCRVSCLGSEPYLISIGENSLIAENVRLVTHDGGVKVLNTLGYFAGRRYDQLAPITIGSNVFIGMQAIIMPGVHIGDNCIIGAGAVVTRDIPANSVAVGVPCKVIKTLEEYYQGGLARGVFYPTAGMPAQEKRAYLEQSMKERGIL